MPEAIAKAAELAKLGSNERGLRYLQAPRGFRDQLIDMLADRDDDSAAQPDAFGAIAAQPGQQLAAAIAEVRSILTGPSIQARCLECGPAGPPARIEQRDIGMLAALKAWLS
jgi:protease-4